MKIRERISRVENKRRQERMLLHSVAKPFLPAVEKDIALEEALEAIERIASGERVDFTRFAARLRGDPDLPALLAYYRHVKGTEMGDA